MIKPIRILHSVSGYNMGGIESLLMSLYRNIDKSIIQFDLLVETQKWLPDFDEIIQNGGRVYQLRPINKKNPFPYISEVKNFFKNHATEYAVVHSHTVTRVAPILYYAKKFGIPCLISHAHTDSFDGNRFIILTKLLMRLNNRLSTHFLAASEQAGSFFFEKDKKTYTVLKNTIDTEIFSFSPEKRESLRKSFSLEEYFIVGHTGRFTYQKNHWKIIDVFAEVHKQLPKSRLLLVGDGPSINEFKEKAKELGIFDYIIFTGARSDVSDLLQIMDVFLLPSFFEAFCISLLEAQSAGLPCVASDIIPKEVQITDLITTLPLGDNNKRWAEVILSYKNHHRIGREKVVIEKKYDAKSNAKWLTNFYMNQVR